MSVAHHGTQAENVITIASQTSAAESLRIINEQLKEAIAASKCHQCGCFQQTVDALAGADAGKGELASLLTQALEVSVLKKYDCLGCQICHPALAANAFAALYLKEGESLDLCPTETPQERLGWPPFPGDYTVVRYVAPVAVCALNSSALVQSLAERRPDGLSIVGTLHTENLGIERVIKNIIANPNIRFMLLCGEDTQKVVGHLPGQSFESLFRNGLNERGRIIDAKGKRPILKNVTNAEVQSFIKQVKLVLRIGEEDPDTLLAEIKACTAQDPGPYSSPFKINEIERVQVSEPKQLTLDKAGYFVIYPDTRSKKIIVEQYSNNGVLNCVLEGRSTGALYGEAIAHGLLTRLDHAAYLGRELARAEICMITGSPFVQDAAPGELATTEPNVNSNENSKCGCLSAPSTKGCC